MKFSTLFSVAIAATFLLPLAATAQSLSDVQELSPDDRRTYMEAMSPEEREAKRAEWKAEHDAMTPEQRVAMRARRDANQAERRAKWESLSDEEREAKREQMRGRRAEMRERYESMSPEEREIARQARGERGEKRHHAAKGEKEQ